MGDLGSILSSVGVVFAVLAWAILGVGIYSSWASWRLRRDMRELKRLLSGQRLTKEEEGRERSRHSLVAWFTVCAFVLPPLLLTDRLGAELADIALWVLTIALSYASFRLALRRGWSGGVQAGAIAAVVLAKLLFPLGLLVLAVAGAFAAHKSASDQGSASRGGAAPLETPAA